MEEMTDALVEKFFNGLCTKEEGERVLDYLRSNPGLQYLLAEWKKTDGKTPLPEGYMQEMRKTVSIATAETLKKTARSVWRWAAAACVAGLVVAIALLAKRKENQSVAMRSRSMPGTIWLTQSNTLNRVMTLVLADSSTTSLSPNSSIRYRKDFTAHSRREIYMTGDILFEVAKNRQRPFIVFCGNLSTTALGTTFRVSASPNRKQLKVRLFEGKVVVAPADTTEKKISRGYYLSPGQELVFDTEKQLGTIHSFLKKNDTRPAGKSTPVAARDRSYMFNNQTLADVLDHLSDIYHIDITYSKKEIGNIYFIGKIDKDDSLEKIISDIATLNKLAVIKENNGYILKRRKK